MKTKNYLSPGRRSYIVCFASLLCTLSVIGGTALTEERLTNKEKARKVFEMYENYKRSSFQNIEDIPPRDALKLLDEGSVLFVDVRSHNEQFVSMLPGAITEKEFRDNPGAYPDRTIVSYCTISYRSGLFAKDMKENGMQVFNLKGGLLGWVHEGGVVYHQGKETKRVHVYGKKWDLAPDEYETTFFKLPFLRM